MDVKIANTLTKLVILLTVLTLSACVNVNKQTILIDAGDSKRDVLFIMDIPADRQIKGKNEVWQYCISGAGVEYNNHEVIWFYSGKVTSIETYRSYGRSCKTSTFSVEIRDI